MPPPPPRWIVTTAPDHPAAEVARTLAGAGFAIEQVLDEVGCIVGRCSPDQAEALRSLGGVADVSPSTGIDIGPPDAPVSW